MLPYTFYKLVHVVGIVLVMSALGAVAIHAANGGLRRENAARRLVTALHGTGMLAILVGGFGMLARLGFQHGGMFPGWLLVKLGVWAVLAVALFLPYLRTGFGRALYVSLPVLGGLATYMAIYKPI